MPFLTQGKTNWRFIGIVVVFAVIAGGGIWWHQKEKEVGDWQVYKNQEYGFEIKYPSAFLEKSYFSCKTPFSEDEIAIDNQAARFSHTFYFDICFDPDCESKTESDMDIGFEICRVEGGYKKLAEGFYDIWGGETEETPPYSVIIAGQDGIGMEGLIGKRAYQRANHYFLEKDENITFILSFYYEKMDFRPELKAAEEDVLFDHQTEIFNQMLSSFQFIEVPEKAIEEEIDQEVKEEDLFEEKEEELVEEEIIERYIKLLYPSGGEEFTIGESLVISWEAKNIEKINITLHEKRDDRAIYLPLRYITRDFILTEENQYQWIIPENIPPSQYTLSISSEDGGPHTGDSSDDYLTISGTLSVQDKEVMLKQLIEGDFNLIGNTVAIYPSESGILGSVFYLYKVFEGSSMVPENQEYVFVLRFSQHKYESLFLGAFDKDKNLISSSIDINKPHYPNHGWGKSFMDVEKYSCRGMAYILTYGESCATGGWCAMRANLYRLENGEFQVFQDIIKTVGDMKDINEDTDWSEYGLHMEIEKDKILVYEWKWVDDDFVCVAPNCIDMYEMGEGYKAITEHFTTLFWDENECKLVGETK